MFCKYSRIIAAIVICFFTWSSGGLFAVAHAAQIPTIKDNSQPQYKQKTEETEEQFARLVGELEKILEGPETDIVTTKRKLKTVKSEIEVYDKEIRKQFAETKKRLKNAKLSAEILERYRKFVQHYDDNLAELRGNIGQIEGAKGKDEVEAGAEKIRKHLQRVKSPARHQQLDPNKLPHRQPKVQKREPRLEKTEFEKDLKKDKHAWRNQKRIMVASVGSLAGLLGPDDLAETVDVQFTPEILQLAEDLEFSPVNIFNFVKNYIEFVPSYGSIQGAHQTLLTGKGNAFDQASLLIALLRSSGIHAKYEYGTIEVPIDIVKSWVGGFSDAQSAVTLLATAGVPCTALTSGGKIVSVRLEHVWVKAWIDYSPSRGAVHKEGDTWIPLDPSYKKYVYSNRTDFGAVVPFDAAGYLNEVKSTASENKAEGWITGVDTSLAQAKIDAYLVSVNSYMDANYPNALEDQIIGLGKISKKNLTILPTSLPYIVNIKAWESAELPASLRHSIRFSLASTNFEEMSGNTATFTKSLPEIVGKRITLSYAPATDADKAVIRSLLPLPHSDGTPLQLSELPSSFPSYLINLVPELRIDGAVVASGSPVIMGSSAKFTITLQGPPDVREQKTKFVTAGDYYAVALDVMPLGEDVVQEKILEHLDLAEETKANLIRPTRDQFFGEFLHTMAVGYFDQLSAFDTRYAASMGVVSHRLPSFGFAQTASQTIDLFGIPHFYKPKGVLLDINHVMKMAVAKDGDQQKVRDYQFVSGLYSSGLEHAVLEQIFSSATDPAEGISTVKILGVANSSNIPVYTITSSNIANVLPKLPAEITADVQNAVNAGKEVITPERNVTISGWTGTGYIVHDPTTGGGAYMISGGTNGGFLTALGAYYMACGEVVYDDDPMLGMEGIMSGINLIIEAQTLWLDVLGEAGKIAFDLVSNFVPWGKVLGQTKLAFGCVVGNITKNAAAGRTFEKGIIKIFEQVLKVGKNTTKFTTSLGKTIPDSVIYDAFSSPSILWEIKSSMYVCDTGNITKMLRLKLPLNLLVKEGAVVSGPLKKQITDSGGQIFKYNTVTGLIVPPLSLL